MLIPIIPLGKHATQTASDLDKWTRPLRILRETVAYFPSLYSIYATFSIGFHNGLEVLKPAMADFAPNAELLTVLALGTCLLYTSDAADE